MKQRIIYKIWQSGTIKRKDLLTEMQLHYPELSDRKMRKLIEQLIRDGEPIASSERGYSMIKTKEQLTDAVNYLKAKASSIAIRANTLISNYDQKHKDAPANIQLKLL